MSSLKREIAAEQGRQTLEALRHGSYRAPSGAEISIRDALERCVQSTVSYAPEAELAPPSSRAEPSSIRVINTTTLAAGRELLESGSNPVLLNFASATYPGGGFLSGALAQEESLARSTGLFASIENQPMYEFHRQQADSMYSDYAIYSPGVPVLRGDRGELIEATYELAIITCAAPNASWIPRDRRNEIEPIFRGRIERVLAIGAHHGHDSIVLGAWGCGVFGNDTPVVAALFRDALKGPFRDVYAHVVFAVLDHSKKLQTFKIFDECLGT